MARGELAPATQDDDVAGVEWGRAQQGPGVDDQAPIDRQREREVRVAHHEHVRPCAVHHLGEVLGRLVGVDASHGGRVARARVPHSDAEAVEGEDEAGREPLEPRQRAERQGRAVGGAALAQGPGVVIAPDGRKLLKFRDLKDKYPAEYAEAGKVYSAVFDNDDTAKALDLSPIDRMPAGAFHRRRAACGPGTGARPA